MYVPAPNFYHLSISTFLFFQEWDQLKDQEKEITEKLKELENSPPRQVQILIVYDS